MTITIPDDILSKYLSREKLIEYKNSEIGMVSITVYAEKKYIE
jgi:arsenite methyltransferase